MEEETPLATTPIPTFHILTQNSLPTPSKGDVVAWCPTMDLIAFAMQDNAVTLYRLNGQRVWTIPPFYTPAANNGNRENVLVEVMTWRPDGKLLAIGYSNGLARICDVNNGKFVHRVHTNRRKLGRVTSIGWTENESGQKTDSTKQPFSTQDHVAVGLGFGGPTTETDLPHDLFDFDISQVLPKLSVLPTGASTQMSFTVKSALDNLINSTKARAASTMDVLLVGGGRGRIVISIFDSFEVGNMKLSSFVPQLTAKNSKVTRHISTSSLKTHILLITYKATKLLGGKDVVENNCMLFPVDLLFLTNFGPHLSQLAYTITKVQYCLRYIKETIKSIAHEYKTMENIALGYVRPLDEMLQKEDGSRAGLELFELLVTGVPSEKLKTWLVDELMERGQKKWEKTSMNGYEVLRRLIHEHLFPGCERAIVLLSHLRGLARWKEKGSSLGMEPTDFTRLLDVVSGLLVMGHDFLSKLNKELELFSPFIVWLKGVVEEMDALATGGDPPLTDDNSMVDTMRVAEFLDGPLLNSELAKFFDEEEWNWKEGESILQTVSGHDREDSANDRRTRSDSDLPAFVMAGGSGKSSRTMKRPSLGSITSSPIATKGVMETDEQKLPGFHQIWAYLSELYKATFAKPAKAMQQQLRVGDGLMVYEKGWDQVDMRMVTEKGISVAYIALVPVTSQDGSGETDSTKSLILLRLELVMNGGLSSFFNVGCAKLNLPPGKSVKHIKFIDEREIAILLHGTEESELTTFTYCFSEIAYIPTPPNLGALFVDSAQSGVESLCHFADHISPVQIKPNKRKYFQHENFEPVAIAVNGNAGRRVGVVLDASRTTWICFDLDAEVDEDAGGSDGEEDEDAHGGEGEVQDEDEDEDMGYGE